MQKIIEKKKAEMPAVEDGQPDFSRGLAKKRLSQRTSTLVKFKKGSGSDSGKFLEVDSQLAGPQKQKKRTSVALESSGFKSTSGMKSKTSSSKELKLADTRRSKSKGQVTPRSGRGLLNWSVRGKDLQSEEKEKLFDDDPFNLAN